LKECVKACLLGISVDRKKAVWVNGRMGSDNVNIWVEKWMGKIWRDCIEVFSLYICTFLDFSLKNGRKT